MLRFIAYAWDAIDAARQDAAIALRRAVEHDSEFAVVFDQPGLAVYACGFRAGSIGCHRLYENAGVVLGTLFERGRDSDSTSTYVKTLEQRSSRIVESGGRDLTEHYWGAYVAFIRDASAGKISVLQDPTSARPVYRTVRQGIFVYFTELADLIYLTRVQFSVDWEYVAAHTVLPIFQSEATAIADVSELEGGICDEIHLGRLSSRPHWRISTFAANRLEDMAAAALELRQTVRTCVHAWASLYPDILPLYSGGVDSSIVLACLRNAPTRPKVTCVTYYATLPEKGDEGVPGIDERVFARIGAQAAGCESIEVKLDDNASFEILAKIAPSPRPSFYLSCLSERGLFALARQTGASAIVSGNGGDAMFGEIADVRVAMDYVRDHWIGPKFVRTILSTAEITQMAVGNVALKALGSLWSRQQPVNSLTEFLSFRKLLSADAMAAARVRPERFVQFCERDAQGLRPGKALHISMMGQPMPFRTPLAEKSDPECIHPLASQLNAESCARMPTYLLTQNGRTRSVARQAFANDVPAQLLARRSKGNPRWLVNRLVERNMPFIRDRLRGGWLVKERILDAEKVERATSGCATDVDYSELLFHVSTEVWLDRFYDAQRSVAVA